jgi:predicted GIY-YIG superfamily endonuclease
MLQLDWIDLDFWRVAAEEKAWLIFTGRRDDAVGLDLWSTHDRRCFVYIFASCSIPLYIGKTRHPTTRFRSHERRDWWDSAEEFALFGVWGETRTHASRKALRVEAAAIKCMRPLENIAGVI